MAENDKTIEELVLLLMYLTSWEEKIKGLDAEKKKVVLAEIRRAWKGYPFDAINMLIDKDYLRGSFRAKSVTFTDEGMKKAEELKKKYL